MNGLQIRLKEDIVLHLEDPPLSTAWRALIEIRNELNRIKHAFPTRELSLIEGAIDGAFEAQTCLENIVGVVR